MRELSNFFSDDMKKQATVFRVNEQHVYNVVAKNDSETVTKYFGTEDAAEQFAEEWVLKDE